MNPPEHAPDSPTWPEDPDERLRLLQLATETSLSAIGIANTDGQLVYINSALIEMWGYDRTDEILGRGVHEFFVGDTIHKTLSQLRDGGAVQGADVGRRKNGSNINVQFSATILPDAQGRPAYLATRDTVDLAAVVRSSIGLIELQCKERGIQVKSDLTPPPW